MFAVGCIQARSCHTDLCPTGVATQDAMRQQALDPEDKAHRVFHFHQNTLIALGELLTAAGFAHTDELTASAIIRRNEQGIAVPLGKNLLQLEPGELLTRDAHIHLNQHFDGLGDYWSSATPTHW
jgi:hypothetical protein